MGKRKVAKKQLCVQGAVRTATGPQSRKLPDKNPFLYAAAAQVSEQSGKVTTSKVSSSTEGFDGGLSIPGAQNSNGEPLDGRCGRLDHAMKAVKEPNLEPPRSSELLDEFSDDELDQNLSSMNVYSTIPTSSIANDSSSTNRPALLSPPRSASPLQADPTILKPKPLPAYEQYGIAFTAAGAPIPFVRPAFPIKAVDNSLIPGLSNQTVLRTCFRIGQAFNGASRSSADVVIELYARVCESERKGGRQKFWFADLFTDKPPWLVGWRENWVQFDLWNEDGQSFLGSAGKGLMCRVIGRMRKDTHREYELDISSIWPSNWYA